MYSSTPRKQKNSVTLATSVTLLRLGLVPFFVCAYYLPALRDTACAALLFGAAAITDWLDGFLARRLKQTSWLGAFLDPIADKVIVLTGLWLVGEHFHAYWITLPAMLMVIREILVSALREWMARIALQHQREQKQLHLPVILAGKLKTTLQLLALVCLLWHPNDVVVKLGVALLYGALVMSLYALFQYGMLFAKRVKGLESST